MPYLLVGSLKIIFEKNISIYKIEVILLQVIILTKVRKINIWKYINIKYLYIYIINIRYK